MIRITTPKKTPLPREVVVACSGGADSIAVASFLAIKHKVIIAYYNHGNEFDEMSQDWLYNWSKDNDLKFITSKITRQKNQSESTEEYWRHQRYEWFHSMTDPVITAHHLDDCVETWIWSSLHGTGKIIPYANKNVIRPFRTNTKQELINWCDRQNIAYLTDPSNSDTKFTRNYIRNTMMPHVLKVNPGISKVIRKKVLHDIE